jgi:hypothetical protein
MAELTLQNIFGTTATQDIDDVVIAKADLSAIGLIANASNTAEHIFVALLLKAGVVLTDAARELNPDISVVIGEPSESLQVQNTIRYRVTSYTIELYKPEPASVTNPMDY